MAMKINGKRAFGLILGMVVVVISVACFTSAPSHSRAQKPQAVLAQVPEEPVRQLTYAKYSTQQQIKNLGVKAAVLVNGDTGQVLYGFQEHQPLHPASVTKLMTLYIILEKIHQGSLQWTDTVPVSQRVEQINEAQVYLKTGEVWSLREMVKAMMVASANDAAVALAEKVAGSEAAFVQMMNERAKELGLKDSHFINVSGLPAPNGGDQNHYMSAYDIALLATLLLNQYPEVLEFSGLKSTTVRGGQYPIANTNKLLGYFQGMDGLKTGYTNRAGLCLAATAKKDDLRLISVVLGAPSVQIRTTSTVSLLNYGFQNYQKVTRVDIDGTQVPSESALCVNGTVLVPLEMVAAAMGLEVAMEGSQIQVSGDHRNVQFSVDSPTALCDGQRVQLAQPVQRVRGQILIPARALSQLLGAEIRWEQGDRAVYIDTTKEAV